MTKTTTGSRSPSQADFETGHTSNTGRWSERKCDAFKDFTYLPERPGAAVGGWREQFCYQIDWSYGLEQPFWSLSNRLRKQQLKLPINQKR